MRRRSRRYTGAAASLRGACARVLRRHAYLILKSWTRIVSMMYYPTVTMVVWAFLTLYLAPTNNFLQGRAGLLHRRRAAVGRALPRPARRVADVHRGVLCAQPRQPVRLAADAARVHRRPARDQRAARADRRRRRVRVRVPAVPLLDLLARLSADRVLREPARVRLGDRPRDVGDDPAPRARRRGARVGGDLHHRADLGRLLSDRRAAVVAAGGRLGAPVGARVRGDARRCCCDGVFRWDHFWAAAALNVVYLALGAAVFAWAMRDARNRGTLLQMGE